MAETKRLSLSGFFGLLSAGAGVGGLTAIIENLGERAVVMNAYLANVQEINHETIQSSLELAGSVGYTGAAIGIVVCGIAGVAAAYSNYLANNENIFN